MPSWFPTTLRALERDHPRVALWTLGGVILFAGLWLTWAFTADITVWETSGALRLDQTRHVLGAPVAGKVVAAHLALGKKVARGEPLVELDAEISRRQLEEKRGELDGLRRELEAIERQIAAEEESREHEKVAAEQLVASAEAKAREASAASAQASSDASMNQGLFKSDVLSRSELRRSKQVARQRRAATGAAEAEVRRIQAESEVRASQSSVRIEILRRSQAELDGRRKAAEAASKVLEEEIDRRTIRSPIDGTVAEMSDLQVGAVVEEGAQLATVVPPGSMKAIATVSPQAALGRIRPGQRARIRLDGFPWVEYGSVEARVTSVASEPRDGGVRVDLSIEKVPPGIRLQHGLTGAAEVAIGEASPAEILFRSLGQRLSQPDDEAGKTAPQ